jgi:hypothetical protein
LRSGDDNPACPQEANGKSKPDKHVRRLTARAKKATASITLIDFSTAATIATKHGYVAERILP